DFTRLEYPQRDASDKSNLKYTLALQAVGNSITLFAMSLPYRRLYTFTELARFQIPKKKSDFLNMVGHLN
ncbi:hypothetical protein J3Q64DRAFT_1624983, partial [Phycomyces blakesleeanus]